MLAQAAFDAEQMSPFFHSWLSTAHIPEQNMNVERHLSLSSNKLFTSSEMTYLKERFGFLEILCRTTFFYTYQEHDAAKFQTCVDLFSSFSKTHALLLVLFTRHAQKGRFYFSSCNSTWLEYILEHKLDCLFSLASPFFEHVVDFARLFTCLFTLPLEFSTSSLALIHQANAWSTAKFFELCIQHPTWQLVLKRYQPSPPHPREIALLPALPSSSSHAHENPPGNFLSRFSHPQVQLPQTQPLQQHPQQHPQAQLHLPPQQHTQAQLPQAQPQPQPQQPNLESRANQHAQTHVVGIHGNTLHNRDDDICSSHTETIWLILNAICDTSFRADQDEECRENLVRFFKVQHKHITPRACLIELGRCPDEIVSKYLRETLISLYPKYFCLYLKVLEQQKTSQRHAERGTVVRDDSPINSRETWATNEYWVLHDRILTWNAQKLKTIAERNIAFFSL